MVSSFMGLSSSSLPLAKTHQRPTTLPSKNKKQHPQNIFVICLASLLNQTYVEKSPLFWGPQVKDIFHRDVKPENLLMVRNPKMGDSNGGRCCLVVLLREFWRFGCFFVRFFGKNSTREKACKGGNSFKKIDQNTASKGLKEVLFEALGSGRFSRPLKRAGSILVGFDPQKPLFIDAPVGGSFLLSLNPSGKAKQGKGVATRRRVKDGGFTPKAISFYFC